MEPKGKILVIDDELGIREGCRRALEPQGFEVQAVETLTEGMVKIREQDFDLVLLDVMMPDGRGIDLLGPIAEVNPEIVPVIITGYATVELAVEAIRRGAYDFITKPFTSDLLLMTVNQGLEKRRLSLESKRLRTIEREAMALAREKEEMERLDQFKTAFMLTVAHELRSPIGSAQSLTKTLLRGLAGELTDQQLEILRRIETKLSNQLELINDLLLLAKSRTYDVEKPLERVSICPLIKRIVEHYAHETENKGHSLMVDLPDEDLAILATEDGLETLVGNLISNAIKYTPERGRIQVKVESRSEMVEINVSDDGIGIPEQDLPRLFKEFFRAKNAKEMDTVGTGLGLSIVRQLVDRFGGAITVRSIEDEGSTFTLRFPRFEDDS